jgi:serine/threonine-protein kinase HipA
MGWMGTTKLDYETAYVFAVDPDFTSKVRGPAALGVRLPPSLEIHSAVHWPPFLLDLLPQGHARKVLAESLGLNQDSLACDTPLLLRAGGSPIGNIRIKQAWDAERKVWCPPPGLRPSRTRRRTRTTSPSSRPSVMTQRPR